MDRLMSSGRYLYYLSQENDLAVIDIFDPVNPRILGKLDGYDDIYRVTARGNHAFATEKNAGPMRGMRIATSDFKLGLA